MDGRLLVTELTNGVITNAFLATRPNTALVEASHEARNWQTGHGEESRCEINERLDRS
ncbi:hypothetical protein D3C84_1124610 [compost metagenome]